MIRNPQKSGNTAIIEFPHLNIPTMCEGCEADLAAFEPLTGPIRTRDRGGATIKVQGLTKRLEHLQMRRPWFLRKRRGLHLFAKMKITKAGIKGERETNVFNNFMPSFFQSPLGEEARDLELRPVTKR